MGCSSKVRGIAGRTSNFQGRFFRFGPVGILSSTRWPTAEVMMDSSFSKYRESRDFPFFSNLPRCLARARERSVMTEGFSAMMRVFAIRGWHIRGGRRFWKGEIFGKASFRNPAGSEKSSHGGQGNAVPGRRLDQCRAFPGAAGRSSTGRENLTGFCGRLVRKARIPRDLENQEAFTK